jgi:hypothetical protein
VCIFIIHYSRFIAKGAQGGKGYKMTNKADKGNKPTNYRARKRATEQRYLWLVVGMLVVGGSVVIGLVYGWAAILTAVPCLLGGALILLVVYFLLGRLQSWLDDRA